MNLSSSTCASGWQDLTVDGATQYRHYRIYLLVKGENRNSNKIIYVIFIVCGLAV
jgi:hypothetical protein